MQNRNGKLEQLWYQISIFINKSFKPDGFGHDELLSETEKVLR